MFEIKTFNRLMDQMLDAVPGALDKRQGSVIYNALAPAAMELAHLYIALMIFKEQTHLMTAIGQNLDDRGS